MDSLSSRERPLHSFEQKSKIQGRLGWLEDSTRTILDSLHTDILDDSIGTIIKLDHNQNSESVGAFFIEALERIYTLKGRNSLDVRCLRGYTTDNENYLKVESKRKTLPHNLVESYARHLETQPLHKGEGPQNKKVLLVTEYVHSGYEIEYLARILISKGYTVEIVAYVYTAHQKSPIVVPKWIQENNIVVHTGQTVLPARASLKDTHSGPDYEAMARTTAQQVAETFPYRV